MKIVFSKNLDDIKFIHFNLYEYNLSKTGRNRVEITQEEDDELNCLVLFDSSDERTGGAVYRFRDGGKTLFVEYLWIADSMRGTGSGVALVNEIVKQAQKNLCNKISLTTNTFQAPGFYHKLGFVTVHEIPDPCPLVPENIHYEMVKVLL